MRDRDWPHYESQRSDQEGTGAIGDFLGSGVFEKTCGEKLNGQRAESAT